jgi:hypothetical protein
MAAKFGFILRGYEDKNYYQSTHATNNIYYINMSKNSFGSKFREDRREIA